MTNVFKKYGMAIVAILMIIGFSAFKVSEKASTIYYFQFDGTSIGGHIENVNDLCPAQANIELCALGFSEEYVDTDAVPMVLKPTTNPTTDWEEQRFKYQN